VTSQERAGDGRDETEAERYDRNFNELLQELRVMQTGGQLLFAFLLTVAFTERFARSEARLQWVYVVVLLCTVLATGLLIAPAAYHRQHFRQGLKAEVVLAGHRLARAGLVFLAGAMSGTVLLVLMEVGSTRVGVVVGVATLAILLLLFFGIPSLRRGGTDQEDDR
jgi:Family of unknown function (DUF6328)